MKTFLKCLSLIFTVSNGFYAQAIVKAKDPVLEQALAAHLTDLKNRGVVTQFMMTNSGDYNHVIALAKTSRGGCFTESAFYSDDGIVFRDLNTEADCSPFSSIRPQ